MRRTVRVSLRALAGLLAVAIVLLAIVAARGYRMYHAAADDGNIERTVAALRRIEGYTSIDDVPRAYREAVVAVEDHRFYEHPGIDAIAIGRAALSNMRTMSAGQGGSTITQQVAKNLFFSQEKDLSRKAAEVFMAFDLESRYSKDTILELYVNSCYFGEGHTGIGQACAGYLGHAPVQMTRSECTLMAGIPNAPSAYSPNRHPDLARKRQRHVEDLLRRYGGTVSWRCRDLFHRPHMPCGDKLVPRVSETHRYGILRLWFSR